MFIINSMFEYVRAFVCAFVCACASGLLGVQFVEVFLMLQILPLLDVYARKEHQKLQSAHSSVRRNRLRFPPPDLPPL